MLPLLYRPTTLYYTIYLVLLVQGMASNEIDHLLGREGLRYYPRIYS